MGGIFILTLPIPIVVNSFASYYKNRLWRNEVAYKKRQRAKKRREMELLMRDNLLNILTVPGKQYSCLIIIYTYFAVSITYLARKSKIKFFGQSGIST